jgi:hypothetical protein
LNATFERFVDEVAADPHVGHLADDVRDALEFVYQNVDTIEFADAYVWVLGQTSRSLRDRVIALGKIEHKVRKDLEAPHVPGRPLIRLNLHELLGW